MSDNIGTIEVEAGLEPPVTSHMIVTAMSGGTRRGRCIQLTLPTGWDLAQMTEAQTRRLSQVLDTWLFEGTMQRAARSRKAANGD